MQPAWVLSDTLPPDVTFVSSEPSSPACSEANSVVTCDVGSLANGANTTITVVVKVPSSATGTLNNTATVAGNESDPNAANNHASEDTAVIQESDLVVTKTESIEPVVAGSGPATSPMSLRSRITGHPTPATSHCPR